MLGRGGGGEMKRVEIVHNPASDELPPSHQGVYIAELQNKNAGCPSLHHAGLKLDLLVSFYF